LITKDISVMAKYRSADCETVGIVSSPEIRELFKFIKKSEK
jgi:hypothetical protein